MTEDQQWYVQSGSRVQGPYSITEVGRYLLLGRIRSTDRVSRDGELWEPVTQVPELIPEELLDLETDQGWQHFIGSRAQAEERTSDMPVLAPERRQQSTEQTTEIIRHQWRQNPSPAPRRRSPHMLPVSLLGVTLVVLLVVIYLNTTGLAS